LAAALGWWGVVAVVVAVGRRVVLEGVGIVEEVVAAAHGGLCAGARVREVAAEGEVVGE
jgi:hypothetical protein